MGHYLSDLEYETSRKKVSRIAAYTRYRKKMNLVERIIGRKLHMIRVLEYQTKEKLHAPQEAWNPNKENINEKISKSKILVLWKIFQSQGIMSQSLAGCILNVVPITSGVECAVAVTINRHEDIHSKNKIINHRKILFEKMHPQIQERCIQKFEKISKYIYQIFLFSYLIVRKKSIFFKNERYERIFSVLLNIMPSPKIFFLENGKKLSRDIYKWEYLEFLPSGWPTASIDKINLGINISWEHSNESLRRLLSFLQSLG